MYIQVDGPVLHSLAVWSSGMILAPGARGPGFNSQNSPLLRNEIFGARDLRFEPAAHIFLSLLHTLSHF